MLVGKNIVLIALIISLILISLLATACYEVEKGKYIKPESKADPQDEKLSDHNPEFDETFTVLAQIGHQQAFFNKSTAVIGLDMIGHKEEQVELEDRVFPSMAAAFDAAREYYETVLPSLDCTDSYAKSIDDRIIRGLEEFMHDDDRVYPGGKQGLLKDILAELKHMHDTSARNRAIAYIAAAIELGGDEVLGLSNELIELKNVEIDRFFRIPETSKPMGIYTETEKLKCIFQRDRLLQQPFGSAYWSLYGPSEFYPERDTEDILLIACVLKSNPAMLEAYETYLTLLERITNPASNFHLLDVLEHDQHLNYANDLLSALDKSEKMELIEERGNVNGETIGIAFWPFSTSKENKIIGPILENARGVEPDFRLMDAFTAALKAGEVDLKPDSMSGFYDYQLYAIETSLLPERAGEAEKLLLYGKYIARLKQAFEAMATQRRETHIKQVQIAEMTDGAVMEIEIEPAPNLSIEPCAEVYLRQARAYRALNGFLLEILGSEIRDIDVPGLSSLETELEHAASVFYGLYLLSLNDIGLKSSLLLGELDGIRFLEERELKQPVGMYRHETGDSRMQGEASEDEMLILALQTKYPVALREGLTKDDAIAYFKALQLVEEWLPRRSFPDKDTRVITPVGLLNDEASVRTGARYWAVTGVQLKRMIAKYEKPPVVVPVKDGDISEQAKLIAIEQMNEGSDYFKDGWDTKEYLIPVYMFAEFDLEEPLDREEFRAICDQGTTKEEIDNLLVKRSQGLPWQAPTGLGAIIVIFIALFAARRRRMNKKPGA